MWAWQPIPAAAITAEVVAVSIPPSGGWESWLGHKKRQETLRREEERRLEQIEAQRLAIQKVEARLAQEQATKAAEGRRDAQNAKALSRLNASIEAHQRELDRLTEHLDALLVLAYLEHEQELIKQELLKRRNNAIILLLLAA